MGRHLDRKHNEDNQQNDTMSLNGHNSNKIDFNDIAHDNNPMPYSASNDSGNDSTMLPQIKNTTYIFY